MPHDAVCMFGNTEHSSRKQIQLGAFCFVLFSCLLLLFFFWGGGFVCLFCFVLFWFGLVWFGLFHMFVCRSNFRILQNYEVSSASLSCSMPNILLWQNEMYSFQVQNLICEDNSMTVYRFATFKVQPLSREIFSLNGHDHL